MQSEVHQQQLVATVNPARGAAEWESTLAANDQATFFHSGVWARILAASYGFTPHYLKIGEDAAGYLPVMEANSFVSGRRGISLPFTDECEPIAPDPHTFNALFRSAVVHMSKRRWRYFEMRGGDTALSTDRTAAEFLGHEIKLEGRTSGELFANCVSSTRRAVRKAEKNGVAVEFGRTSADMDAFYSLFCQTRQRHGNPPQPRKFFQEIQRHAIETGSGLLLLARHNGIAVAGAVFLHFGRAAIYKFGASDSKTRHLAANNLIMWRAIEWYNKEGFSSLRLGRTSLENDGLRQFKQGWGSHEYHIKYFRYGNKARDFLSGTDNSSTGWQTRVFKFLPQRVSRHIGAVAYRHIA
jgi:hypothetical protein